MASCGRISERHWQIGRIFDERFGEVAEDLALDPAGVSPVKRRLIGAYFCHEYSTPLLRS